MSVCLYDPLHVTHPHLHYGCLCHLFWCSLTRVLPLINFLNSRLSSGNLNGMEWKCFWLQSKLSFEAFRVFIIEDWLINQWKRKYFFIFILWLFKQVDQLSCESSYYSNNKIVAQYVSNCPLGWQVANSLNHQLIMTVLSWKLRCLIMCLRGHWVCCS